MPPKKTDADAAAAAGGVKRQREWGADIKDGVSPPASPAMGPAGASLLHWRDYYPAPTGDIDLAKYDSPIRKVPLEWWYYNCHLTSITPIDKSKKPLATPGSEEKTEWGPAGQRFSLFASFFAQADEASVAEVKEERAAKARAAAAAKTGKTASAEDYAYEYYHACTWAVSHVEPAKYLADSLLDHRACDKLRAKLDPKVTGRKCQHAEAALLEMVQKGRVPRPDRLMKKAATIDTTPGALSLDYDGDCIVKGRAPAKGDAFEAQVHGSATRVYDVTLKNPIKRVAAELTFVPLRAPIRHGTCGLVNRMFYYYIPRMAVRGTVTIRGVAYQVEGSGWYDREFGGDEDATGFDASDAWTWFSCQLSDDCELSFYNVVDKDTQREKEKVGVYTTKDGTRIPLTTISLSYSNLWTSLNTYIAYPMMWKLSCPEVKLDLYLTCVMPHQEFMTVLVTGCGFYEGRVNINGSHNGKEVTGTGFLERKNHVTYKDTAGLLKNVGVFVKKTLEGMYPLNATQEWIDENVLGRHAQPGTDPKRVCDQIFAPVRALIDRGGKSWRSLILVSSVNALSEDYFDCASYIAISELLHVGSLIIDDIQDESSVRRGGRCVHLDYGTATAINAGTCCYFMAPILAGVKTLTPPKQLALYDLYFDVLRSGHAGQGLDICGLDDMMPHAVETGDTKALFQALKAIHIYKTGGAAGTLCKIGCVICDARDDQHELFEKFGTAIGFAFQIVDDALNLKGFEGDLKEAGEDVKDGKVTYPVIKALGRLDRADREYVWMILKEKTSDTGKIGSVISKLNSVCAIDDCLVEARNIVEEAWDNLEKVLPDSLPKIMVRTFCTYLTERTF